MTFSGKRPTTYYLDTSVYNQLVHQPGHPEYIAVLKRARDEGRAVTYVSRHLLQELVSAFPSDSRLGGQLMCAVREIAVPGALVKDTPDLNRRDLRRLIDPSADADYLEPASGVDARKVRYMIEVLAQETPPDEQWRAFCQLQRTKQRNEKRKWLKLWREFVKEERPKFDKERSPETLEEFMGRAGGIEARLAMVQLWTPKALRTILPLDELARRLDETVSFRGMLLHITSCFFWKVLKDDPLHPGDAFDAHHSVAAANFDVFVCKDEAARKYAAAWCRNGQRVVPLAEFMNEVA